jgi:hypothetical protein
LNPNPNALVAIQKTETQGDLYDTVLFGDQTINYPRPFMFTLQPAAQHPNQHLGQKLSRVLSLYDNAGESFLPGADTAASPVTRHLALSSALLFLFDPTQDPKFRKACQGTTQDPQMLDRSERLGRERAVRQDTILQEAAHRVRRYAGLAQNAKHSRPLILIVTKYDCWSSLLESGRLDPPWVVGPDGVHCGLQLERIESLSKKLRALLWNLCPEIVSAAENFAEQVIYVPVSATGCSPELDPKSGALGVRPRDMNPMWTEVPLLYLLSRCMEGLVPYVRPKMKATAPVAGVNMLPPHLRKQSNGQARDH